MTETFQRRFPVCFSGLNPNPQHWLVVGYEYDLLSKSYSVYREAWNCILSLEKKWKSPSSQALLEAFGAVCVYSENYYIDELNLVRGKSEWLAGDYIVSALSPETVSRLTARWTEVDFTEAQDHFGKYQARIFRGGFDRFTSYLESWRIIFLDAAPKGTGIAVWIQ